MFMGVAKCPGGVDGSLVGVEDYLGFLLLFFACQAIQLVQAVVPLRSSVPSQGSHT